MGETNQRHQISGHILLQGRSNQQYSVHKLGEGGIRACLSFSWMWWSNFFCNTKQLLKFPFFSPKRKIAQNNFFSRFNSVTEMTKLKLHFWLRFCNWKTCSSFYLEKNKIICRQCLAQTLVKLSVAWKMGNKLYFGTRSVGGFQLKTFSAFVCHLHCPKFFWNKKQRNI